MSLLAQRPAKNPPEGVAVADRPTIKSQDSFRSQSLRHVTAAAVGSNTAKSIRTVCQFLPAHRWAPNEATSLRTRSARASALVRSQRNRSPSVSDPASDMRRLAAQNYNARRTTRRKP